MRQILKKRRFELHQHHQETMLVMHEPKPRLFVATLLLSLHFRPEAFRANGPLLEWAAVQETDPHRSQRDLIVVFFMFFFSALN